MSFSVLMSVYAKESPNYLSSALRSLELQTFMPIEVVIVEDGPISSELAVVIESYRASLNIKTVKLDCNMGLAMALNVGLTYCNCELVARMDSDDICLPDRFEKQFEFMRSHPYIDCCSGIIEEWDEEMSRLITTRKVPNTHSEILKRIRFASPINHPAVMYRKSSVLAVGGYPNKYPEDPFLWLYLINSGFMLANLPDVILKMRAGRGMLKRRGLKFARGEFEYYINLYQSNLIRLHVLVPVLTARLLLRVMPVILKSFAYKHARLYS